MAESGINPRDHFIRQRRNLVLISLFAIFYKAGGLKLLQVNFFGNVTAIERPEIVSFALVGFFVYFLWRYYSACNEVCGISNFWLIYRNKKQDFAWRHARYYAARKLQLDPRDFDVERNAAKDRYGQEIDREQFRISGMTKDMKEQKAAILKEMGDINIKGVRLCYVRVKAMLHCVAKSSAFSEYVVPYVLASWAGLELCGIGLTELIL